MVNPLIFVDLPTPDPEATSQFYEKLFDWKYKRRPAGEFHEVLPGVKPNLGIHLEETPVSGPVPIIYVIVDDPPDKRVRARERGAKSSTYAPRRAARLCNWRRRAGKLRRWISPSGGSTC